MDLPVVSNERNDPIKFNNENLTLFRILEDFKPKITNLDFISESLEGLTSAFLDYFKSFNIFSENYFEAQKRLEDKLALKDPPAPVEPEEKPAPKSRTPKEQEDEKKSGGLLNFLSTFLGAGLGSLTGILGISGSGGGLITMLKVGFKRLFAPLTLLFAAIDFVDGFMKGYEEDGLVEGIKQGITTVFDNTISEIVGFFGDILSWVAGAIGMENLKDTIGPALQDTLDGIKGIFLSVIDIVENIFTLKFDKQVFIDAGWQILDSVKGMLLSLFDVGNSIIRDAFGIDLRALGQKAEEVADGIMTTINNTYNSIVDWFSNALNVSLDFVQNDIPNFIMATFENIRSTILDFLPTKEDIMAIIPEIVLPDFTDIQNFVNDKINKLKEIDAIGTIVDTVNSVIKFVTDLFSFEKIKERLVNILPANLVSYVIGEEKIVTVSPTEQATIDKNITEKRQQLAKTQSENPGNIETIRNLQTEIRDLEETKSFNEKVRDIESTQQIIRDTLVADLQGKSLTNEQLSVIEKVFGKENEITKVLKDGAVQLSNAQYKTATDTLRSLRESIEKESNREIVTETSSFMLDRNFEMRKEATDKIVTIPYGKPIMQQNTITNLQREIEKREREKANGGVSVSNSGNSVTTINNVQQNSNSSVFNRPSKREDIFSPTRQ